MKINNLGLSNIVNISFPQNYHEYLSFDIGQILAYSLHSRLQ